MFEEKFMRFKFIREIECSVLKRIFLVFLFFLKARRIYYIFNKDLSESVKL